MLAAGMAHGQINYTLVNQIEGVSDGGYTFELDGADPGFKVFFDGSNTSSKPCVLGTQGAINPTPYVLNELDMSSPYGNDNNGVPVMPFGTPINSQATVGTNTVAVGYTDAESKNEGYLYKNGETDVVGQWPSTQDTFGYVALAMVNTNATPATTNYGWVQLELNYAVANPYLRVIDYAYNTVSGSNILAGQEGDISFPQIYPYEGYPSPTSQTNTVGATVNFYVSAMASPAPTYQWQAGKIGSGIYTNLPNAGVFSGANTPNLTLTGITPADQLDYVVVVSNANGSVTSSPPATLIVLGGLLSGPVPPQQMIYAGYPAQINVTDIGDDATTNQWELNGTNILNGGTFSGVATTDLMISSVNPTNVGNYLAIASTAYGSVTSSVAPLSIVYPDGTPYEATVLADGAVDYYRLDETSGTTAWDFIGGNNGTYGSDAVLAGAGPTAATGFPGFANTNDCATFQFLDANNLLPCLPWNINTNAVTLTAWIYPEYSEGNGGIVYSVGTNNFACGIRYDFGFQNTNGVDGDIGYNWNDNPNDSLWDSGITAPHNQWSLVALTISPTNATIYIINTNGVQFSVNSVVHSNQLFNATEYIGTYPSEGDLGQNNFAGNIDEVAIFNSTLSQNQILGLYNAAVTIPPPSPITIKKAGTNIQLQWTGGTLLQATNPKGPWTTNSAATSPYIISPTNTQEYFRTQQ